MDHVVYTTPAGAICTCGFARTTITGGEARRSAQQHLDQVDWPTNTKKMVDLRTAANPQ